MATACLWRCRSGNGVIAGLSAALCSLSDLPMLLLDAVGVHGLDGNVDRSAIHRQCSLRKSVVDQTCIFLTFSEDMNHDCFV
jgi:hypothetical protein